MLAALLLLAIFSGCGTRYARHEVVGLRDVQVDLVSQVEGLFGTVSQGYEHPAVISEVRIVHILNAIEVETPLEGGGFLREPALYPGMAAEAAGAIAQAFAEADPDQAIGVKLTRKEAKFGIFHTKYLTSFLAFMKDDHLYIELSRVNWPIPQPMEAKKLPEPRRGESPQSFRIVSGEHLFYAGSKALEIDWRSPVFRTAYHLPGTSGGVARRKEILLESPIPKEEMGGPNEALESVDQLSPEQLRALADLEEDRNQGRITEAAYQRAKRQLLRER